MKRKILHIVFSLDPGGMENGLVNVACKLPEDEFQVDVCCLERKGGFADRLPEESKILILDKPPGKSLPTIAKLGAYLALTTPDVVHTHDFGPLAHAVWATMGGVLAPILHGEHCEILPNERTPSRLRQRARYFKFCRGIHTVSETLTTHMRDLFGLQEVRTIVNGVDTDRFRPRKSATAKRDWGLPQDAFVVGVVGRFIEHKRQMEVLTEFMKLAERFPKATLLMPGDGPTQQSVVDAATASPFADRILLPGFMDKPENAYHAMDILLMPSLFEGLSNAILEAMSCGVPSLAHVACGCRDVVTHNINGLLMDIGDDVSLNRALSELLRGEYELSRLGKKARETVLSGYSIESMAAEYANLYRSIIGGR